MANDKYKPIPELTSDEISRFWANVERKGPDECWLWKGAPDADGYGRMMFRYVTFKSHRLAYRIQYGEDPGEMLVCHTCDTPACCNGVHLFSGTDKANRADCCAKNRQARNFGDKHWSHKHPDLVTRGEKSNLAKLTVEQVIEIQGDIMKRISDAEIARRHGLGSAETVRRIRIGVTWNHVRSPGFIPQC